MGQKMLLQISDRQFAILSYRYYPSHCFSSDCASLWNRWWGWREEGEAGRRVCVAGWCEVVTWLACWKRKRRLVKTPWHVVRVMEATHHALGSLPSMQLNEQINLTFVYSLKNYISWPPAFLQST